MTLGLLRALADKGEDIGAAKTGPDYIDCAFLAAASREPAINLDSHAMPQALIRRLAAGRQQEMLVIEGVMGLFDGTHGGSGSTAQLAASLGAPILLVLDTRHQGQTAAALAAGIETQLPAGTGLAGVVLNRIASPRHEELIREALEARSIAFSAAWQSDPGRYRSRHAISAWYRLPILQRATSLNRKSPPPRSSLQGHSTLKP